jgi:putative transposase
MQTTSNYWMITGLRSLWTARDNVRTERFFRTLKYDRIYINEYETPRDLRIMLNQYMETYNTYRPHSSLGGASPVEYYLI